MKKEWSLQTRMIHEGQIRSGFMETSEALYLTSGYIYSCAEEAEKAFKNDIQRYVYSRYGSPTVSNLEDRLCAYEEGAERCHTTTSGMAAVYTAIVSRLKTGDRVVASRALFGSCHYIISTMLPKMGVETVFVDGTNMQEWEQALSKPTQLVFIESPSNPLLEVIDIRKVSALTHQAGGILLVDNVFATPVLQKPFLLGADMVVYSMTKHIDGQGRSMGGAILCREEDSEEFIIPFMRHAGPGISPFNAWIMLKSLETLELRVEKHCSNAAIIASHLEQKKQAGSAIKNVIYPGLPSHPHYQIAKTQMSHGGPLLAFEFADKNTAFNFMNALSLILISNNLGDSKSLITHPETTTHQRLSEEERFELGIKGGGLRLSVGLESSDDLCKDIDQSLNAL